MPMGHLKVRLCSQITPQSAGAPQVKSWVTLSFGSEMVKH